MGRGRRQVRLGQCGDQAFRRQRIELRLQLTGAVKFDAEDRNRAALQVITRIGGQLIVDT